MHNIFHSTIHLIFRNFLSLALIIAVLIVGKYCLKEFSNYQNSNEELQKLVDSKQKIDSYYVTKKNEISERLSKFESKSVIAINSRIKAVDQEIIRKHSEQKSLGLSKDIPGSEDFIENMKLVIDLNLLEQERKYLTLLTRSKSGKIELKRLRHEHVVAYNRLQEFKKESLLPDYLEPLSTEYKKLHSENHDAYENYERQREILQKNGDLKRQFKLSQKKINTTLHNINKKNHCPRKRDFNELDS